MSDLPTGYVTFLFTDIEGSTRLYQAHPEDMPAAIVRHNAILKETITAHGGHIFQVVGDATCAAFDNTSAALEAALAAQRALQAELWGATGPIRVRMGLHCGSADARQGEYLSSLTLVRAQRCMSAGHGGQTLMTEAVTDRVRTQLPADAMLRDLGVQRLRGLAQLEHLYQLVTPDLPVDFPPLRVPEAPEGQLATAPLLAQ